MSRTVRVYWKPHNGRTTFNYNWPGVINFRSVVVITASEFDPTVIDLHIPLPGGHLPNPPDDDRRRFVGEADFWVGSISPHGPHGEDPGGVTFVVRIDWDSPVPVATDITVLDPRESIDITWPPHG